MEDTDIDPNLILKNLKIFCLEWWLWCINYIIIKLVLFGPLNGGPGDPKVPKMQKPDRFYRHGIRGKCARILCQLTPHSWNFGEFPFNWENWEIFANSFSRNFWTWFSDSWENFERIFGATCFLVFSDLSDPPRGHGGH